MTTQASFTLREITSRLTEGLKDQIPDLHIRVDHILTKQVFGIGIKRTPPMLLVAGIYLALLAFALVAVSIRM